MKRISLWLGVIAVLIAANGCGSHYGNYSFGMKSESSGRNHVNIRYRAFKGTYARVVKAKTDGTLHVSFSLESKRGSVSFAIKNPNGETTSVATCTAGTKQDTQTIDLAAGERCDLIFRGNNTAGSFSAKWSLD